MEKKNFPEAEEIGNNIRATSLKRISVLFSKALSDRFCSLICLRNMQNKHLFSRQKAIHYLTVTFFGNPEWEITMKTAIKFEFANIWEKYYCGLILEAIVYSKKCENLLGRLTKPCLIFHKGCLAC